MNVLKGDTLPDLYSFTQYTAVLFGKLTEKGQTKCNFWTPASHLRSDHIIFPPNLMELLPSTDHLLPSMLCTAHSPDHPAFFTIDRRAISAAPGHG